jgi:hypothetical protein
MVVFITNARLRGLNFLFPEKLTGSAFGRTLRALSEDEIFTQSLGKNVYLSKVIAFTVNADLAARGLGWLGAAGKTRVVHGEEALASRRPSPITILVRQELWRGRPTTDQYVSPARHVGRPCQLREPIPQARLLSRQPAGHGTACGQPAGLVNQRRSIYDRACRRPSERAHTITSASTQCGTRSMEIKS